MSKRRQRRSAALHAPQAHAPLVAGEPVQPPVAEGPRAAPPRLGHARLRLVAFAALCAIAVLVAGTSLLIAAQHARARTRGAPATAAASDALASLSAQPHLLFLVSDGDVSRQVALLPLNEPDATPLLTPLSCQRVYFAAGRGLCLGTDPYRGGAFIFDSSFTVLHRLTINGLASRVRVSPDGRYGSMTVFVQGDSYANGAFSTRTEIVDMAAGTPVADLEDFTVLRDGSPWRAQDFNFWGITFARDSNRFYATLGSGGTTYLVAGDIAARQVRVLTTNVECPSLSPDNTRIAFKKRLPGGNGRTWQPYVLDLATMSETALAETHNVDDQIEWLDNDHVLYSLPDQGPPATIRPDLWTVPADGSGTPRRLAIRAFSPAVVRSAP